jgi:hypothetical protein
MRVRSSPLPGSGIAAGAGAVPVGVIGGLHRGGGGHLGIGHRRQVALDDLDSARRVDQRLIACGRRGALVEHVAAQRGGAAVIDHAGLLSGADEGPDGDRQHGERDQDQRQIGGEIGGHGQGGSG